MAEHIRFYNASYFVPTLSRCAKGGRDANSILDRDLNEENITFFYLFFLGIWNSTFFGASKESERENQPSMTV